jgi:kynurenine 3-monooxygenase
MPSKAPVSLVVGAGPAGILSAVYLARRGHEVHLFDRRPSPLVCDASDHRAFFVMLQPRGAAALEGAGFALRPDGGLQQVSAIAMTLGRRGPQAIPFKQPRLMGPRHAFVRQMVEQAEAMQLPNLHFHFETAFEAVDLAAQTATLRAGSTPCDSSSSGEEADGGSSISFSYDLLVAADGGWSRVRRAAEAQTSELQVGVFDSLAVGRLVKSLACLVLPFWLGDDPDQQASWRA